MTALHLDQKGRGRALRAAWSTSTATVVAYMDVDLATGLDALLPLVAPLLSGHSDLAIGTRLAPGAHVVRGARREFISRAYNLLLRSTLAQHLHRRPVRIQGPAAPGGGRAAPAGRGRGVVLRHRGARHRPTHRAPHPRGPGRLGGRPDSRVEVVRYRPGRPPRGVADARLSGRRHGRSAARPGPRHPPTIPSSGRPDTDRAESGTRRSWRRRPRRRVPCSGREEPVGPTPTIFADELLRFAGVGRAQHAGLRGPVRRARARPRQLPGQRRGHRPVQPRQHRRPPGHGRHGPSRPGPAPSPGGRRRPARGQPGLHHGRPGRGAGSRRRLRCFRSWRR